MLIYIYIYSGMLCYVCYPLKFVGVTENKSLNGKKQARINSSLLYTETDYY